MPIKRKGKTPKASLDYIFSITYGDTSADGHEQTETFILKCNKSKKEVETVYKNLCKKLKFGLHKLFTEYENNVITAKDFFKLKIDCGEYLKSEFAPEYENELNSEGGLRINSQDLIYLFLFVMKTHHPEIKFEIIEYDSLNINIGGYGLFI